MTKEEMSKLINRLIVASDSLPEIVEDKHFLQIVDRWIDAIQDTSLCGGIEFMTLIKCYKALEKQIPKKPIDNEKYRCFVCPTCDLIAALYHDDKLKVCRCCGQRLDWSDVDEQ